MEAERIASESMKTGPTASVARSGRRACSSNRSGIADKAKRPSGASVWFEEVCANPSFLLNCSSTRGEVSERFKEHAWKACVGEILPWVRIPPFPPCIRADLVWPDLPWHSFMIVRTVEQVRRAFRIVAGFTLLLAGVVMIVTPGPGWLVIFLGLSLLAAEFIWARRLMDRMKRQGDRVREAVWPAAKNVPSEPSAESNELE